MTSTSNKSEHWIRKRKVPNIMINTIVNATTIAVLFDKKHTWKSHAMNWLSNAVQK